MIEKTDEVLPIMKSASFLAAQGTAHALGYELMARIVLTPSTAVLLKAQVMQGSRLRKLDDLARPAAIAYTVRKADLVPRPSDYSGEAFTFIPQPGDEQLERTFETLHQAGAWLGKFAADPAAAGRADVMGFKPGETASVLVVPASPPPAQRRVLVSQRMADGSIVTTGQRA